MSDESKQRCARCGSCTVVCPVFRVTGRETLAARGKLHLLSTELAQNPSGHFQDIFAQCLLCGACEDNCSRELPICDLVVQARSTFSRFYGKHPLQRTLARVALSRPTLLEGLVKAGLQLSRLSVLPEDSGLRIKLGLLEHDNLPQPVGRKAGEAEEPTGDCERSYFAGCMARYLQPSIAEATVALTEKVTGKAVFEPAQQVCCGLAAWSAGRLDEARKLARRNIEVFASSPGEILTSCASCSAQLEKYPALFAGDPVWQAKAKQFSERVREFTSYIDDHVEGKELVAKSPAKVFYHEPCHLRFDKKKKGAARHLLARVDSIDMVKTDPLAQCCGQGGLFHLGYPELSEAIFSQVYEQLHQSGADVVITSCSGCLMQWQAGLASHHSRAKAVHLAVWLKSQMQI